jgi:hypothetical protein
MSAWPGNRDCPRTMKLRPARGCRTHLSNDRILELAQGYMKSQLIHAAIRLGIADLLAQRPMGKVRWGPPAMQRPARGGGRRNQPSDLDTPHHLHT